VYQVCYDTIWTLARALNETLHGMMIKSMITLLILNHNYHFMCLDIKTGPDFQDIQPNSNFGLQNFKYSNFALMENVYKHLSETNFTGIVVKKHQLWLVAFFF